jgi:hypothetical protein
MSSSARRNLSETSASHSPIISGLGRCRVLVGAQFPSRRAVCQGGVPRGGRGLLTAPPASTFSGQRSGLRQYERTHPPALLLKALLHNDWTAKMPLESVMSAAAP